MKGLNDQYSYAKSQIIITDPLPSIHKAFSLIIQQEHTHPISNTTNTIIDSPAMAMAVQSGSGTTGSKSDPVSNIPKTTNNGRARCNTWRNQGTNRYRTHYGLHNHTIDTCYAKNGYPPRYQNRGNPSQNRSINNTINEKPSKSNGTSPAPSSSMATSLSEL